jgi:hypothetical protein
LRETVFIGRTRHRPATEEIEPVTPVAIRLVRCVVDQPKGKPFLVRRLSRDDAVRFPL